MSRIGIKKTNIFCRIGIKKTYITTNKIQINLSRKWETVLEERAIAKMGSQCRKDQRSKDHVRQNWYEPK